jgi:DMSO/TMAO reductase YedYZ molybdopterin-dependent catalytic subunit
MNLKFLIAFGLWVSSATGSTLAQKTSDVIRIAGLVDRPLMVTMDTLRTIPIQTGGPINIVSTSGQVRRTIQSFRGVLLRDLLDKAHIQMPDQKQKGKYYVVAQATDGYTAVFAHNELFNNPTGRQVFVLFEEDGKPIGDDGAFVLLTADDTVTGARHVKWLNRIDVRKVE